MKHEALDDFISGLGQDIPVVGAGMFFVGLKKLAEEEEGADTPPAAMGFDAPLEDVCAAMLEMVAYKFKKQVAYATYAKSVRGLSSDSLRHDWNSHAQDEAHHANYFLRRVAQLKPSGFTVPSLPACEAHSEPRECVESLMALEQAAIAGLCRLRDMLGGDPAKHTVEDFLRKDECHLDELRQLVPFKGWAEPEKTAAETLRQKVAGLKTAKDDGQDVGRTWRRAGAGAAMGSALGLGAGIAIAKGRQKKLKDLIPALKSLSLPEKKKMDLLEMAAPAEAKKLRAGIGSLQAAGKKLEDEASDSTARRLMGKSTAAGAAAGVAGATGTDKISSRRPNPRLNKVAALLKEAESVGMSLSEYVNQEAVANAEQAKAELEHTRAVADQAMASAQQLEQRAATSEQQAQQAQQGLATAQQAAVQVQEQAAAAQEAAAGEASKKLELKMQFDEMRQALADLASANPNMDGAFGPEPTSPAEQQMQQQQQQEQAAQQQAQAQEQQGGQAKPKAKAKTQKEVGEAQNAQAEAQKQTAQAEQAVAQEGGGAAMGA